MLPKLLLDRMKQERLSLRDVAKEIGVSHTTVARVLNGDQVDIDTLDAVARWLNVPLASVLNLRVDTQDAFLAQIQLVIGMYPELKDVFSEVFEKIISGEVDPRVLADIAAYAAFRTQQEIKSKGRVKRNDPVAPQDEGSPT